MPNYRLGQGGLQSQMTIDKGPSSSSGAGVPCVGPVTDYQGQVDGTGYKNSMDDPRKIPLALIPPALVRQVGQVLGYGARKYAPNNWRKGMKWSEVYSAMQRHLLAWQEGEDIDPESGLPHLAHAGCCLAFLMEYAEQGLTYGKFDDRFKPARETHRNEAGPQATLHGRAAMQAFQEESEGL